MNKCPRCGTYIPDGGKVCLSCGWKPGSEDSFMDNPILKYMQEAFDKASPEMTEDDKIPDEFKERDLAAVGYIGPVFLYSLIKNSSSELVRYHAKQSAMLLVILAFLGARNAYFGKKEPVPFVGQIISSIMEAL